MFTLLEPCTSCDKCCSCMYEEKENRSKRYEESQQTNTDFVDCFESKPTTAAKMD